MAQAVKNPPAMQETQETWVQFPVFERSPGEGNGHLLQCSCLGEKIHTHTHTHGFCTKLQEKFFTNLIKLECFWLDKCKKYYLDSNFRCFHLLVMVVWLPWVSYFLLSLSLPTKIYYRLWKKENSKVRGYYFCILPEPSYANITDGWNLPQTSVLCPY